LGGALSRLPPAARIGLIGLAVAAVVAAILVMQRGGSGSVPDSGAQAGALDGRAPVTGEPAPDFALATLNGEMVRLSGLRGTPVVLNFWATWCGPCRREMPDLQESYAAANGAFVVLAVNSEGTATDLAARLARDFRDELGLTFPILLDSPATDVFNQYRLRGLPDTFFIDRDGVIRESVVGPLTRRSLEEKLQSILK
jgi:peroxiredoxin